MSRMEHGPHVKVAAKACGVAP